MKRQPSSSLRQSKQASATPPPSPAIPAAVGARSRPVPLGRAVQLPAATIESAGRYAAEHGRTLEEAVAELVELFASEAPGEDATVTLPPVPPVSVTLSAEASELVRWLVGVTHHRPAEAVDGAVHGALRLAREAYDDPHGDESFNCLLRDVLGAQDRERSGRLGCLPRRTVELDDTASALLAGYQREHPEADARDVVSAAVEFILDDEVLSSALALKAATARRREVEGRRTREDAR